MNAATTHNATLTPRELNTLIVALDPFQAQHTPSFMIDVVQVFDALPLPACLADTQELSAADVKDNVARAMVARAWKQERTRVRHERKAAVQRAGRFRVRAVNHSTEKARTMVTGALVAAACIGAVLTPLGLAWTGVATIGAALFI